jgi:tetratricopeptide (TPR) repeat protein
MKKTAWRILSAFLVISLSMSFLTACGDLNDYDDENVGSYDSQDEGSNQSLNINSQGEPGTWLVMLYQDADDEILERDIFLDLNEAEIVGSSDMVTIVSQLDRYDGGFDGDGDWTSTKRFLVLQDNDLETIGSEELADLGEMDMSDPQTLEDFVTWAISTYPAERYALIMSDHGMGWLGGWTDSNPNSGEMSLSEIDSALYNIVTKTGIGQLDFFGFDACLMAQLEAFSMLAPYAQYAVASEETEPAIGWAYASFLGSLVENPAMSGADLAKAVVDSYISEDYRIANDDARVSYIEENYEYSGDIPAQQVAADMSVDITLSAIDLSQIVALNEAMNQLVMALTYVDQSSVAAARAYAQSYTSVFDKDLPDSFYDLGNFVELLMDETGDADVVAAGQQVLNVLQQAVLAEKHGEQKPGSTGISFYFPNSKLYTMTTDEEWLSYTSTADRFGAASLWDDFLVFHYMGKEINAEAADLMVLDPISATSNQDFSDAIAASAPETGATVEAPGSGDITVGEVTSSTYELAADETTTISAEVSGTNIGYIYYYVSYYSEADDSFLMADMEFLSSDTSKEIGGTIYPDWGDDTAFIVSTEWSPTVYYLNDGVDEAFIYLEPEVYGATYEEDVYTLYGLYAPGGDESKQQEAMIKFDGYFEMKSFWVFTGEDGTGAPRQATLKKGDTFTVYQLWQDYIADTEEWEFNYYLGDVLTYYGETFTVVAYEAFSGIYEVGIRVQDYDGYYTESFINITVPEF